MLLCKACNTRFGDGHSACPSCGRRVFTSIGDHPRSEEIPSPLPQAQPLEAPASGEGAVDVELDESDVLAGAVQPRAAGERKPDPPPRAHKGLRQEPGPSVFHLSAAQVRTLVAEQPDLVEPGLSIYADEGRRPVGVDYRTPVGAIDLLARDARGGLVVVMVPDARDVEALIPLVLGRVGYVRKHLASAGQSVRGLVVVEQMPEALAYAAAGVSETLSFHTYRVALTFRELEV